MTTMPVRDKNAETARRLALRTLLRKRLSERAQRERGPIAQPTPVVGPRPEEPRGLAERLQLPFSPYEPAAGLATGFAGQAVQKLKSFQPRREFQETPAFQPRTPSQALGAGFAQSIGLGTEQLDPLSAALIASTGGAAGIGMGLKTALASARLAPGFARGVAATAAGKLGAPRTGLRILGKPSEVAGATKPVRRTPMEELAESALKVVAKSRKAAAKPIAKPPIGKPTEPVAPKAVTRTLSPRELIAKQGGYITAEDDIGAMVKQHGDFAVVVKDVNGERAIFNASRVQRELANPAFSERVREIFVQQDITPVSAPEIPSGFMSSLRSQGAAPIQGAKQIGSLADIGGVRLSSEAKSVTPAQQAKFVEAITDNELRGILAQSGVKEIRIQPSYKFGLSEQANISKSSGVLNINADVIDAKKTILHELGHAALKNMTPSEKAIFLERAKISRNPAVAGYLRTDSFEEAAAELMYTDATFRLAAPKAAAPQAAGGAPPVGVGARLEAPPPAAAPETPVQATSRIKGIQQKGQQAPESVALPEAKEAHVEFAAPDGPRPPKPPPGAKGGPAPSEEPADIVRQIAEKATKGERPDQTLLRFHEAAIGNELRRNGIIIRDGNAKFKALGIGVMRRGQLVPRTEDIPKLDALYNALHNPSKVASGEVKVPQGYEAIYRELRDITDWEQAARLDFDPNMAMVQDYFYRGWKPPEGAVVGVTQGRPLVKTPAFKKLRVAATYQELRDAGFEPLFWNPYQQWGLSRMQGTKYREQMELVAHLKGMGDDFARPHAGGPIPEGWRVPEVGPAFEGKPFATTDAATGEPVAMFTRRWIVPDRVANTLENIYGKRPSIGKVIIGGRTLDPLAVIDWLTFVPKRAKLMFSFFQQVDFLERAGAGSWSRMVDALQAGRPVEAVKALAQYPKTVSTVIRVNFSPGFRQTLARQLDSTEPLISGRPGVHLKGISEAGLSTFDPAMFRWEEMDKVARVVAQETGILGKGFRLAHAVGDLESAMRRGLFEGVYPAAMITDIRNNIAPMAARMNPKMNAAQLNGTIARIVNIKYSSIPASQSVLQNRVLRETLRRVFFSIGESEGLLRQAAGAIRGPNAAFWRKHWLGTYLFVIATASAIHFASTGKPLPKERYSPVSKDKWGPLPFGYNTRFASPTIPLKGRGGAELTLDVVGQMDTALRILNPGSFITARESVPIRALVNQLSGTDFYKTPIDDVGPGGVVSRTAQLLQDLFSPIGAGGLASEAARRTIPGAEKVISEGETRLGTAGLGIQATGLNLRAATREMRLRSTIGPQAGATLVEMEKLGAPLGYVTRKLDMRPGVKGGEVELTSAQREQLQWLTDDVVVRGLAETFAAPEFQRLSDESKKEVVKEYITKLRAAARDQFRLQLTQDSARQKLQGLRKLPEAVGAR